MVFIFSTLNESLKCFAMSRALSPFGLNLLKWVSGALLCMGSGRSQGLLLRTPWPALFWFGSLSFRNWRLQVRMKEVPCFHDSYHWFLMVSGLYYSSIIPSGCCLSSTGSYHNKMFGHSVLTEIKHDRRCSRCHSQLLYIWCLITFDWATSKSPRPFV